MLWSIVFFRQNISLITYLSAAVNGTVIIIALIAGEKFKTSEHQETFLVLNCSFHQIHFMKNEIHFMKNGKILLHPEKSICSRGGEKSIL